MKNKLNLFFFLSAGAALIAFDIYKASTAYITIDECWSYADFVPQTFWEIISYSKTTAANNHILNTLLMKFFVWLGGNSELLLRMPNILGHILYLFISYRLLNRYIPTLFIPCFLLLNLNPFLLDFFSLARGYGLAISLMLAGMYHYCRYIETPKNKHYAMALLFTGMAVLANFIMLTVFLSIIFIHATFCFLNEKKNISIKTLWHNHKITLLMTGIFFAGLFKPLHTLLNNHLIVIGNNNGFWADTVTSLIHCSSYFQPYEKALTIIFNIFIALFSVISVAGIVLSFINYSKLKTINKIFLFMSLLLFLVIAGHSIQHSLFNVPFVVTRVALFFYPLFICVVCFSGVSTGSNLVSYIGKAAIVMVSACFTFHTCYSLTPNWYYEWRDVSLLSPPKTLFDIIQNAEKDEQPISVGASWFYEPALNYYRKTLLLEDRIKKIDSRYLTYKNDFFVATEEDKRKLPAEEIRLLEHEKTRNSYLLKHVKRAAPSSFISIKAANNKYVCADWEYETNLVASKNDVGLWETFIFYGLGNNRCHLRSFEYFFLSAELHDACQLTANRSQAQNWETFTIIQLDSSFVAFKADNGKYWTLNTSDLRIYAKADTIGPQERFIIEASTEL